MDSDTDSDSEVAYNTNHCHVHAADFVEASTQLEPTSRFFRIQDALRALQERRLQPEAVDSFDYETIGSASSTILRFLDSVVTAPKAKGLSHDLIDDFIAIGMCSMYSVAISLLKCMRLSIVEPSSMSQLFDYRRAFHAIAARNLPPGPTSSVVVCWVDVVLTKLVEAIVVVAGGANPHGRENGMTGSLAQQKENEALTTASQLPQSWSGVLDLMTSDWASPAVVRMALRLTFAAYIIHPQLTGKNVLAGSITEFSNMQQVVHTFTSRFSMTSWGGHNIGRTPKPFSICLQDRTSFAMMVVLYAASARTRNSQNCSPASEPYTQTLVLGLIQAVMHHDAAPADVSPLTPFTSLDLAQTILCSWGDTVPRCWEIWSDPRCTGVESVSHLTSTWLYHLEAPCGRSPTNAWAAEFLTALAVNPGAAEIALVQLLHHAVTSWPSSAAGFAVVGKACWGIAQLLNSSHTWHIKATPALTRCLLVAFLLCTRCEEEYDIQSTILEALTYVDHTTLRASLKALLGEDSAAFAVKLDNVVASFRRDLHAATKSSVSLSLPECRSIASVTNLLALLWCKTALVIPQRPTSSTFLATLVKYLSCQADSPFEALTCALLTAVATLGIRPAGTVSKIWDDEMLWGLAISRGRKSLLAACNCSTSIILSSQNSLDFCNRF
ncbi:hypothetical protein FA95DRAFT_201272 [Auriscalpium vulgare]|uniref:Uncharacterized protein n=1 Tax=Auriscalpium vulgare TaxID=40419 RepID=A0ACB8S5A8_9AGAM|nr:hypothetical protein FA95DRAFT_201272 [Auriscalpium vulgare]